MMATSFMNALGVFKEPAETEALGIRIPILCVMFVDSEHHEKKGKPDEESGAVQGNAAYRARFGRLFLFWTSLG